MLYPVPVVMISCGREGEKPNIITVAWAGTICSDPVMVSISVRKERYSHKIIKDTGEFVINLVNKRLIRATDFCGVESGKNVDKFQETRLTPLASRYVKAPGIEESPLNLECKVVEVKELGSHDMFIANVVGVTIDNQYMGDRGKFNLNAAGLVSYSHGEYFELGKKLGSFGYSVKKSGGKKRSPAYIPGKRENAASEKNQEENDWGKKAEGKGKKKEYGDKEKKSEYGGKGRKAEYGDKGRKAEYGDKGRKAEYGDKGKKAEYGDKGRKSEYGDRGKKKEFTSTAKKWDSGSGAKKHDYAAKPGKSGGQAKSGRRTK